MSYEIGMAALNLQMTERVARTEYTDSWEIVRHYSGLDPRKDNAAWRGYQDAVHLDYLWTVNDGPVPWSTRGRVTDLGHAVYNEDGSDFHASQPSPFTDFEQVLSFNAVDEYGMLDFEELTSYYEESYQNNRINNPNQVVSGGYYKTLVSGAIEIFGFEMMLEAMGEDSDRFGEEVLEGIFQQTLHHIKAWANTSIDVFMCHDDMVWTEGPFISPNFYRKYIFPRYKELWQPLKDAGKRVLYTSDGTYDMFFDDIAAAGADGFCFEPTNDINKLVRDYGQTHVIMGGADCRTLTWGSKADIEAELRSLFDLARPCPGFVFATGNHLPSNIPLENAIYYFDLIEEFGKR